MLPAFLLETAGYLVLGFESVRTRLERQLTPWLFAALLAASALAPYCVYTLALGRFQWSTLGTLAALVVPASFWYVVLPHLAGIDVLFVALMALAMISRIFTRLYPAPIHGLEILGQLMWIRVGVFALLSIRRVQGVGFGFVPSRKDWATGLVFYLIFLPVGAVVAGAIHYGHFHAPSGAWWKAPLAAAGTFLGILWVVALSEEFVFRGLLQQWLSSWLASDLGGLLLASALFGSVHLFRGFPNWKQSVLAGVLGIFCGLAFRRAKSIRASMVTHALAATTWRLLFS